LIHFYKRSRKMASTHVKHTKTIRSDHPEKAFQQLDVMRREGRFTDIHLLAGGKQFPAHRAVLCACSPYFDRMFQPGFVEQSNNQVELKDFDSETLSSLLDYMYKSKITITEDNAQDILIGANLLLLYNVKEAAGEVLSQLIDDNSVLDIRNIGSMFSCRDVESRAHNYMLERFEYVCKAPQFLKLDAAEVLKYLQLDDVIVKSEESIFYCVTGWIDHNVQERKKHFDYLIDAVRFPLVSDHSLNLFLNENEYVKSSSHAQKLIKDSIKLKAETNISRPIGEHKSLIPQYRGSNQLLFLQCNCTNTSDWMKTPPVLYDFKKNSWSSLTCPNAPCREDSSYVFHSGSIYCIAGGETLPQESGSNAFQIQLNGDVYTFSLEEKVWTLHSKLNLPRKRQQCVVLEDVLYVLGGSSPTTPTNSVEILHLGNGSKEWKEGPAMLNKRVSHGAVELNGCIYVIGGWNGQGVVKSVEKFNPKQGTWQEISKYTDIRMKSGVAALDGKLYVVGGCLQTLETCYKAEVFDPEINKWIELPPTKHARTNPVLVPYKGKLYVFGGEGNSMGIVECFDPFTKQWSVLSTTIKHFFNGAYAGCLVDKPWDWDMQQSRDSLATTNRQLYLSAVGLDVVQTFRDFWNSSAGGGVPDC